MIKRYWIVPVLLSAGVGPYVARDNDGTPRVPASVLAIANQIQNWSSSTGKSKGAEEHLVAPTFGANSSWPTTGADSTKGTNSFTTGTPHTSSSEGAVAGSVSTTFADTLSNARSAVVVQPISGSKTSSASQSSSGGGASTALVSSADSLDGSKDKEKSPDPVYDFHEILRFDVSPRWVITHWPRVTTVLAELELEGLRVPLVTGTKSDDLAGSLTYYFDKQHVVQRLTFQGFTGDDRRLVRFVAQSYGLKQQPTLGAGLYMLQWNGEPRSALRLTHMPIVRSSATHQRQEVMLEINRPRSNYGMSGDFKAILKSDRESGRW